jgi:hypothetical protein
MAIDPNILRQPGVSAGLRRMAAAQASGYGSIASRADPNRYGSIESRKYPGLFGPGAEPTGQEAMQLRDRQELQRNNLDLSLRQSRAELQQDPEQAAQLRQLRQQYGLRSLGQKLGRLGPPPQIDPFGGADEDPNDPFAY